MRILLTLQAILNYLYNNIIDLIWVKKVRFEDDSEQTTSSPKIYDIKILSQVLIEKGFSFLCKTIRQELSINNVPTLYNDILTKYLNCEKETSPLTDGLNWYQIIRETCHFAYLNGSFYKGKDWDLSFTNNYQSGTFSTIFSSIFIRDLITANNCIIIIGKEIVDGQETGFLYKLNPSTNVIRKLTGNLQYEDYEGVFNYKIFDGKIYINYCSNVSQTDDKCKKIFVVTDDLTDFVYQTIVADKIVADLTYYDNNFYVLLKEGGTKLVYVRKTDNLQNINSAPTLWQDYITNENGYDGNEYTEQAQIFNFEDTFYLYFKAYQDDFKIVMTDYRFVDIIKDRQYIDYNSATGLQKLRYCENKLYIRIDNGSNSLYSADLSLGYLFTVDDEIKNIEYPFSWLILSNLQFFAINTAYSTCVLKYRGINNKVYTDTYVIEGNSVTIDYVKFEDWKICLKDGGTNDTNLETVYSALGYYNYWWLDTANQLISLPRDNNTFSVMFVGDDFVDNVENLPANNSSKIVLEKEIEDKRDLPQTVEIDTAIITINSIKANKCYRFTNANITDITFNGCETSNLETTIEFSTGNSAPTLTDNSNLSWNGGVPILNANKSYTIVIFNKKAFYEER